MRRCHAIFAMICVPVAILSAAAGPTRAADDFPYTAYVQSDDVYVRSGPGATYYATDKLSRGDTVEVYRLDGGGWCAVRPPRSSFSWVASRHVKLTDAKLGEVTADGVVVRVGSNLSDLRDVSQVRLDQGEEVEIIDAPRDRDGTPKDPWWKITPPSGEFRWIAQRDLAKDPPAKESRVELAAEPLDGPPSRLTEALSTPIKKDKDGPDRTVSPAAGWTAAGARDSLPPALAGDDFRKQLADLDLNLSKVVAQDPGTWRFDDLLARCDDLLARAPTTADQDLVREMHKKITKFDDLAKRNRDFKDKQADFARRRETRNALSAATPLPGSTSAGPALGSPSGGSAIAPTNPNEKVAAAATDKKADSSQYDGVGKLTRVVSKKTGAPTFALVGPSGEIVTFVTPAPGVSLFGYAGQEVGLSGEKGYSTDLNKPVLTAARVTVIK